MLTLQIKGIDQPFISMEVEIGLTQAPARWSAQLESPRGIFPGTIAYSGEPDPTDPTKVLFEDDVRIADNAPAQVFRDGQLLIDGYVDKMSVSYSGRGYSCKIEGRSKNADYVEGSIAPGSHRYSWTGVTLDELARELLPTYRRHRKSRYDLTDVDEEIIGERETQFFTIVEDEERPAEFINPTTGEIFRSQIRPSREFREGQLQERSRGFILSAGFDWSDKALNNVLARPEFRYIYSRTDLTLKQKRDEVAEELRRLGYTDNTRPPIKSNSPESYFIQNLSAQPSKSPWTLIKEEGEKRSFLLWDTGTFCTLWNADYRISNISHITEEIMNSYRFTVDNQNRFHLYIASDHSDSTQPDTITSTAENDELSIQEKRQIDEIIGQRDETNEETLRRLKTESWTLISDLHRNYNSVYVPIDTDIARVHLWFRRESLSHYSNELDNAVTIEQANKIKAALQTLKNERFPNPLTGELPHTIPVLDFEQVEAAQIIPRTAVPRLPVGDGVANFIQQLTDPYFGSPLQEDLTADVTDMNIRTSRVKIFYQGEEEELGIYQKFNRFDAQSEDEVDLQQKTIWEAKKRAAASQTLECSVDSHDFVVGDFHRVTLPFIGFDQGRVIAKAVYKQSDSTGETTSLTLVRSDHLEPLVRFLPDQTIADANLADVPLDAMPETEQRVYRNEAGDLIITEYENLTEDTPVAVRDRQGREYTITYGEAIARYGKFREVVESDLEIVDKSRDFGTWLADSVAGMWQGVIDTPVKIYRHFVNDNDVQEFLRDRSYVNSAAYHVLPRDVSSPIPKDAVIRVSLDPVTGEGIIGYKVRERNARTQYLFDREDGSVQRYPSESNTDRLRRLTVQANQRRQWFDQGRLEGASVEYKRKNPDQ